MIYGEQWSPIFGYIGIYSISSYGVIRRDRRGRHTRIGRILKSTPNSQGYHQVSLYDNGQRKNFKIHNLVMRHFVGFPNGREVNHKNKNKSDNTISNLEYVTRIENMQHSFRHPTGRNIARGEKSGSSKLSWEKVFEIRASKKSDTFLAKQYGVCKSSIDNVRNSKTWRTHARTA